MGFKLIVDPTASLPPEIIEEFKIQMFGYMVTVNGEMHTETRDNNALLVFYDQFAKTSMDQISIMPFTKDYVHHHFTEYVLHKHDFAFVQTASALDSDLFSLCNEVQPFVLKTFRAMRERGELETHFRMRTLNTEQVYAGLGLVMIQSCELITAGTTKHDLVQKTEEFKTTVTSYTSVASATPKAATLSEKKGFFGTIGVRSDSSVSIIHHQRSQQSVVDHVDSMAKAVDAVCTQVIGDIERGVSYPIVTISYAGLLGELDNSLAYNELKKVADVKGLQLVTSMMSMTAAATLGHGAISAACSLEQPSKWQ